MHYELLALDKGSVRRKDQDGRLYVAISHISKANVCPYRGSEIPKGKELGLEPDRVYKLLRAPEELERGAATFNNIPILSQHVPVTADQPRKELIIGSTGTDAAFAAPYLDNSLVFWDQEYIAAIEDDEQRELSCAYHYRADMTPGAFDGMDYDGVMRDLRGNHVALVENGRAGDDVVVGDAALKPLPGDQAISQTELKGMKTRQVILTPRASVALGALMVHMQPKLAQDAKMPDLRPILVNVTAKNWSAQKARIAAQVATKFKGVKLAQDADLADVVQLLDKLDGTDDEGAPEEADVGIDEPVKSFGLEGEGDPEKTNPMGRDAEVHERMMEFLKDKMKPEDIQALMAMLKPADGAVVGDEETEEAKKKREKEAADKAAKDKAMGKDNSDTPGPIMQPAMDAAIKSAISAATPLIVDRANKQAAAAFRALRDAEEAVRPFVGKLELAMDSADEVYKFTLEQLGVATKGVHPSAYPAMLSLCEKPGERRERGLPRKGDTLAMDGKAVEAATKRFPGIDRLKAA